MKYGICVGVNQIKYLKDIGCDYAEISLSGIAAMTDSEFELLVEENEKSDVKIEATNGFFPSNIRLVWPDFNIKQISEYTNLALYRASELGIKTCVLGSGISRKYGSGYTLEDALSDFKKSLSIISEIASRHSITVCIEPLSYNETNVVNTVIEAYNVAKSVNKENIKVMADFYHMRNNNEDFNTLKEVGKDLIHVHISGFTTGRTFPMKVSEDRYKEFFDVLKEIGYDKSVSIEAGVKDLQKEGKVALEVLRSL